MKDGIMVRLSPQAHGAIEAMRRRLLAAHARGEIEAWWADVDIGPTMSECIFHCWQHLQSHRYRRMRSRERAAAVKRARAGKPARANNWKTT
jgi:hypothetical protein